VSANKKYAIALILALCILLSSLVSGAENKKSVISDFEASDYSIDLEATSTRHLMDKLENETVVSFLSNEGFEKKIENNNLEVWFREETASIHFVDKRTGYIWGELLEDKPENMSKTWSAFANSICTVEYYDKNDKVKQLPLSSKDLRVDYIWEKDTMTVKANAKSLGLKFEFEMKISEASVTFQLNDESIVEKVTDKINNRVKSIYFMPFLGSVEENKVPGYILLPDGSGALMRFSKKFSYINGFEKKIYGADVAVDNVTEQKELGANRNNDYMVETPQITLPLFGIVHGNGSNAILSVSENGEEYASVTASPAGYVTDYNWAAMRYDYRNMYVYQAAQDGTGVNTVSADKNTVNPKQTFYFLNGRDATYSGMAVFYRELLKKQGTLKTNKANKEIPLAMSVIGSDIKDGFFVDTEHVLTTIEETKNIVEETKKIIGSNNLTITYYGWKNGGMSKGDYITTKFNKKLGSENELKELKETLESNGGTFYLAVSTVMGNKDQLNVSQMASVGISKNVSVYENANQNLKYWQEYTVKPKFVQDFVNRLYKAYSGYSVNLTDLGYRLYSDYTRGSAYTRTETKKNFLEIASKKQNGKLALNNVNGYLFSATDEYFDIPTVSSQYLFETDTIPFLQIVLKGSIGYYGPYINQGFSSRNSLLKHIEYGMYPSFIVMAAENSKLTYTPLENYFSINYNDWLGTAVDFYSEISQVLNLVEGSEIEDHISLDAGVVKVKYSNGITVYVNYSSKDYNVDGITVGSMNWKVKGA